MGTTDARVPAGESGFTLLELLTVIAVLAVLGGVATLGVSSLRENAEEGGCSADAQAIDTAEQALRVSSGAFGDENALVASGLLDGPSEYHDVVLEQDGYELVGTGPCTDIGVPVAAAPQSACTPDQIDINTAGIAELDQIIHIGPARAQQIIDLRPFAEVSELVRVNGISDNRVGEIIAQGLACS